MVWILDQCFETSFGKVLTCETVLLKRSKKLSWTFQSSKFHQISNLCASCMLCKNVWYFPTCQVRVVRFYVSCPRPPSSSPSSSSPSPCLRPTSLCRHFVHLLRQLYVARCRWQWAAPDLNREVDMGSTGPQQGGSDASGQRRTSTGELQIAVGSAGHHPGGSGADWAMPDLTSQNICQKICQKYVRQECQKICQKKCQKICQ